MTTVIMLILVCFVVVSFLAGRKYERKQFVRVGKPIRTTQEVLGVFKNAKTR